MVAFLINTLTVALTSSMLTGHGLMATPRMRSAPPMAISSPFTFDGRSSTETASPYDMGGYGRYEHDGMGSMYGMNRMNRVNRMGGMGGMSGYGGMNGMGDMGGMGGRYGGMSGYGGMNGMGGMGGRMNGMNSMGGYGRMSYGHGGGMYGGMGGMGGRMGGHMGMSEHQLAMGARREGRARMGGYDE